MLKGYCGTLAFFLGAVLFLILPPAAADEIALHDGRTIKGKVEECGDIYKLHLKYGTISIPAVKVKKILIDTGEELNRKQLKERERIAKEIEEVRKHSNWRNAYKEESKHFVFKYNVTPEIAKGYIDLLEGFYKDFCKELGVRLGPGLKRKKMEINIFRDKENYTQVGGVPGAAGHFNFVEEELFFYHDRNDPEFVQSVLLHEFTHLLTHLMKSKFCHPTWCNEGLAEYYGASKREGSKLVFGGMQEGRLVTMNKWREEGNDYTLEELIKTPRNAFHGLEYGWAWSFIHFVMGNKKYKKKFMKYYIGLAKDKKVKQEETPYLYYPTVRVGEDFRYFRKVFGAKNIDKINKEWHDYIDTNLSVTSGAGYLYDARVLFWKDKNDEALESILIAEEKWEGELSPILYQLKGRILMDLREYEDAKDAFMEAIKIDPINGRNYYYLGDALEEMDEEDILEEAVRNKNLALELAPDDYNLRFKVERDERRREKKAEKEES